MQILFAKISQQDVARFGNKWVRDPDWPHELKMTPNLTVHTAALLRGVWGGRGSLVGGVEEILGAQTKQIRRRYWREGGSIFQPTPQLPHEKGFYDCLTCPHHLLASRRGQQSVLNEGVSPGRSFPSSLRRSGWQAAPPPSRYFSLLPAFCSPGHHHQYSHTLGDLASYKEEILFTISQPCAANIASSYMIFRTDP